MGENELKESLGGDEMNYLLKINYYPPCPRPDLVLGVVAHTDMSAITILVPNPVQGLQLFKDGHWFNVNYIPNALIIHIGDQLEVSKLLYSFITLSNHQITRQDLFIFDVQILSNGKYKAVLHRTTVNNELTRMSWPVFLEPPPELAIGPLPKLISEDDPPKYKTKKYSDYVFCKLNKIPQ